MRRSRQASPACCLSGNAFSAVEQLLELIVIAREGMGLSCPLSRRAYASLTPEMKYQAGRGVAMPPSPSAYAPPNLQQNAADPPVGTAFRE